MNAREVVYASAGFGKTFRISSRILELLATGTAPSELLASTFTRKAAGEILERVLQRLAEGALTDANAAALAAQIFEESEPPAGAATAAFWGGVLHAVVRELPRLEISTLDSFFARVVRAFGNELGLVPGWSVADEPTGERMRRRTLEALVDRRRASDAVQLVRALDPGEVHRSIHERLLEKMDDLVRADLDRDPDAPGWSAMSEDLPAPPEDLDDVCRRLAERLLEADVPRNKDGSPKKRWLSALEKAAGRIRDQQWTELVKDGPANKLLVGETEYVSAPIPEEVAEILLEAIHLARAVEGQRLARRADALGRLAADFRAEYDALMRGAGALRFDDVTRLMAGAAGSSSVGGAPVSRTDFARRMNGELRHILLDEFQDTSLAQWRALEPLLEATVGREREGDRAAVIVADPKQSIYGWRGGSPEVVPEAERAFALERRDLPESRRSSPAVLHAVNAVFEGLAGSSVLDADQGDDEVAAAWMRAFIRHESASNRRDLPGRVRVIAGPALLGTKRHQPALLRFVAERVAALAPAVPGFSIGVLTRDNLAVGRIILELRRLGIEASQEGGTPLGDSPALGAVFALLRLADHPGDRLAAYHVAHSPLGEVVGSRSEHREDAKRLAARVRRDLLRDGYGPWLSRLAGKLSELCSPRERDRLARLATLGYRWDHAASGDALRVGEFLDLALAERVADASDAPVRVMTIHQSKGLQFDFVVLAELHAGQIGGGRGESGPIVYRAPRGAGAARDPAPSSATEPVTHIYPAMNAGLRALFDHVAPLREGARAARAASVRDSISALYVAMTRAKFGLDLVVPADVEGSRPRTARTHDRLVREALGVWTTDHFASPGELLWAHPESIEEGWWERIPTEERGGTSETSGPRAVPRIELGRPRGARRRLDRTSPSGKEGGARIDVRLLLGLNDVDGRARARGTLVHAWMEEIDWIESSTLSDDLALEIARRVTPELREEVVQEYLAWLRHALEAPEVTRALSKERAPPGADPRAEVPILVRDGDDALMRGFIDRLVVTREGSEIVRARILDYKTDRFAPGDPAALRERVDYYRPQLDAYREAVRRQFGVAPDAISAALVFLEVGRVVEC